MIYIYNTETNEILPFIEPYHLLSSTLTSEPYRLATDSEIEAFKLKEAKEAKIAQCDAYLDATDKYFIEAQEANTNDYAQRIPRQQARDAIASLKSCETLEELENININFS
jgi:hypothetical protein